MNKVITDAHNFFKTAGFDYAICGGFALDIFVGKELRTHGDFDIMIFNEDKQRAVQFMQNNGWPVYGRFMDFDIPATLTLFYKITNITDPFWNECINMWSVKPGGKPEMRKINRIQGDVYSYEKPVGKWDVQNFEFIEIEVDTREGNQYVVKNMPKITRTLDKAILYRDGIPYLAPEIVLFYKSDKFSSENLNVRPKTEKDYKTIMPLLSTESKKWLLDAIDTAYPDGHHWLDWLFHSTDII